MLTAMNNWFWELFFPIRCAGCFKITSGKRKNKLICSDCLEEIKPSLYLHCPNCEARTINGGSCLVCQGKTNLDRLIVPLAYQEKLVQKIIKAYKYNFIKDLARPISKIIINYLNSLGPRIDLSDSIIIPVPLHRRRFNYRGYNQALLLAESVAKEFDLNIIQNCLLRIRNKKPQAELEKEKRMKNVQGVFKCLDSEKIKNKNIILIDDVYTTGATMNECARILKENGAKKVIGLAIARG